MIGLGRYETVFSLKQEEDLVKYLNEQEKWLSGLTIKELCILAYQLAEKNGIEHPFQHDMAGRDWCRAFLKRHAN